jgi:hypothetical protein
MVMVEGDVGNLSVKSDVIDTSEAGLERKSPVMKSTAMDASRVKVGGSVGRVNVEANSGAASVEVGGDVIHARVSTSQGGIAELEIEKDAGEIIVKNNPSTPNSQQSSK